MTSLRRLLLDHRALALWLALAALAVKLLVPAGFMVGQVDGRVVLQLCSGFGPVMAAPMHPAMAGHHDGGAAMDHSAMGHGGSDHEGDHRGADMPCPFAALAHGASAPVDPVLLAVALAFAVALGLRATTATVLRAAPHLRPPPIGPPLSA